MNYLPWIAGLLGTATYFTIFEAIAFRDPTRYATLSNAIATLGHHWPLSIFFMGLFSGVLAAHFFWPWMANPLGPGAG